MKADVFQFLRELSQNNERLWFQTNKDRYEVLRKAFLEDVQAVIARIALFDPSLTDLEAKNCVFRIYRDMRFSPDKTPYKTHFGAYMAMGGKCSEYGGYYLHLEPDGCLLSGGIWMPPSPILKKLRMDIYNQIEEFVAITEAPSFKKTFPSLEGDMLSHMPVGYPADSPYGYILKHKDFCVTSYLPDTFFLQDTWLDKTVALFKKLQPFNQFLNYTIDEHFGRL